MLRYLPAFACALALFGSPGSLSLGGAAEDYAIKFDRPRKVGERYHVFSRGAMQETAEVSVGGKTRPMGGDSLEVDLHADVEVLAVSDLGKEKKIRLTATRISVQARGRPEKIFPDGTPVLAELAGKKTKYSIEGRPVDERVRKALDLAFRLSPDANSDDEIFGTSERQTVGQRWRLNPEKLAESLARTVEGGVTFRTEGAEGDCELTSIEQTPNGEVLRISGRLRLSKFSMPLPNNLQVRDSQSLVAFTARVPADLTKGPTQQIFYMVTEFLATGENGGVPMQLTTKNVESRDLQFSAVEAR